MIYQKIAGFHVHLLMQCNRAYDLWKKQEMKQKFIFVKFIFYFWEHRVDIASNKSKGTFYMILHDITTYGF